MVAQSETAVLLISDIHYGKKTASYNEDVIKQRMGRVAERLASIRSLLGSAYQIDELVIALLGDINDGTDIYPTQAHHQSVSNVEQQASEVSELLASWIHQQADDVWGRVRVEAIPGNHGRSGKSAHDAANWDVTAYRYLALRLGNPRWFNHEPGRSTFIRRIGVRDHNMVLYHGHRLSTTGGVPFAGLAKRAEKWATTSLAPFEVMCCGHFHTLSMQRANKTTILTSGTPVTGDEWGLENGYENSNEWWLFGVSDSRPVTWQFAVDLT